MTAFQPRLLQTVEAIRMYGAAHEGKLPPSLDDLPVPVPLEPFTGQPLDYQYHGDHAVLNGHEMPSLRYRLILRFAERPEREVGEAASQEQNHQRPEWYHVPTRAKKPQALPADFVLYALLVAIAGGSGAFADEPPDVAADVAMVRPLIGETTALVVKIDPQRLAPPDLEEFLEQTAPEELEAYRQAIRAAADAIAAFRAATGDRPVYGTIGIPLSHTEWPVFFFLKQTPELGAALEAVAAYPIQLLLLPPDYVRRTVVELMPQLPPQLGGGPSEVLTEGLRWAALGLDPAQLRAELIVQSASEAAASRFAETASERLREHLSKMIASLHESERPAVRETFEAMFLLIAPAIENDRVVLRIDRAEPAGRILRLIIDMSCAARTRADRDGLAFFSRVSTRPGVSCPLRWRCTRERKGVGSRFRPKFNHMESGLSENDSRPLPPIPLKRHQAECLRVPTIRFVYTEAFCFESLMPIPVTWRV